MLRKTVILSLLLFGVIDLSARMPDDISGWWLSPGLTAGRSTQSSQFIGTDVSLLCMGKKLQYGGLFTEGGFLIKEKGPRMISGFEFGFAAIGLDAGMLYQRYNGKNGLGYSIRPYLSVPFYATLNLYIRRNRVHMDGKWDTDYEFGLQLKYPLKLR